MLKNIRRIISVSAITVMLAVSMGLQTNAASTHTVKAGDSLWKISRANNLTVDELKQYNSLTSDTIYIGQKLNLSRTANYTVKSGDTLWLLSRKYSTTVNQIKSLNKLKNDTIYVGQRLYIPNATPTTPTVSKPTPVYSWPSVTYTVKAGDTVSAIASRFGTTQANIIKYNYLKPNEWLNEGQKIAISGYAPRNYAVMPGESSSPSSVGKRVDWFRDGQYLINRNDVLTITDVKTGQRFKVVVMGGVNHADVEPVTASDTAVMRKLFPTWTWTPRPVVIYHDGINFAASLSGKPHSFDTVKGNNVTGHFDLYLSGSTGHASDVSSAYVKQHQDSIMVAAGVK